MKIRYFVLITFWMTIAIMLTGGYSYSNDSGQPSLGDRSTTPPPSETQLLAPDSLTLKYKPDTSKTFKPYLGTGLVFSTKTQEPYTESKKEMKAGVGVKAGFGLQLGQNSSLNFDYKYLYLTPDIKSVQDGATPQQIGIGYQLKF